MSKVFPGHARIIAYLERVGKKIKNDRKANRVAFLKRILKNRKRDRSFTCLNFGWLTSVSYADSNPRFIEENFTRDRYVYQTNTLRIVVVKRRDRLVICIFKRLS